MQRSPLRTDLKKNIILVGASASGKSTVGYQLAKLLGWGYLDTDALIQLREKKSVAQIFLERGEDGFRASESAALNMLAPIHSHVIVCGAGLVLKSENRELLGELGLRVWIDTPYHVIRDRLIKHPEEIAKRPFFANHARNTKINPETLLRLIEEQNAPREALYREAELHFSDAFATAAAAAIFLKMRVQEF